MKIIGLNIKKIREEKGINLRTLAKELDLTPSFISQVESGKATPSIGTLKKIADFLQTTVGILIGEDIPTFNNPVMREDQRKSSKISDNNGIEIFILTSQDSNKQMEPLLFKLNEKSESGEMYKHFGQEFVLVLKGILEITLNDIQYILKKGDSIYFNSSVPHSFRNIFNGITEALWVITPPSF
jgi:transcriptional regulator with XRE-family HTH domain